MQGLQHFQANAMFYLNLETFVAPDHLLRKIDRQVDFSFIRQLTASYYCSDNGRPSVDPEVFFRIMLISYLYGISSDRRLCEQVHYNLAYRWFCHLSLTDKVPDHSSLTRIRDRLGTAIFKQFFQEILWQCKTKGLIKGERLMSDSTLIAANASLNSLVNREFPDHSLASKSFDRGLETPPRYKVSNETHVSKTDADATLAQKKGTPQGLKYKAHLAIDADSCIILDTHITTGACHESQVYVPQVDKIGKEQQLKIKETIADRAYGSGDIIQALSDRNIEPVIPLFSGWSGSRFVPEGFVYDKDHNRYECPAGHYLIPYPTVTNRTIIYHSNAKECAACQLKSVCLATPRKSTNSRIIRRSLYQELYNDMKQKMQTAAFKRKQLERMWKIEGIIGEAKTYHALARAKYRGLFKMQIQAYLSATVQNIKRIVWGYIQAIINYLRIYRILVSQKDDIEKEKGLVF